MDDSQRLLVHQHGGILLPALPLIVLAFVGGLLVFILRIVRKAALRRAR
jgi:hypothetical protein